jgi:hypothetical protein
MSKSRVKLKKEQKLKSLKALHSKRKKKAPAPTKGRPAKNKKMAPRALTVTNHPACKETQSETPSES